MIFLTMIFLHIVDDYYLQGILAQMKQKKFWKEQTPDELYKYDYIWALIMHAFSWTFMIMLPLIFVSPISPAFYVIFVVNQENLNDSGIWSLGLLQMDFFYRKRKMVNSML